MLTVKELANYLGVNYSTIKSAVKLGLPFTSDGKRKIFKLTDVKSWADKQKPSLKIVKNLKSKYFGQSFSDSEKNRISNALKYLQRYKKETLEHQYCLINIRCKVCGKVRNQGFFFTHSGCNGVSNNRTCLICSEHKRRIAPISFEEYEKRWIKKYNKIDESTELKRSCVKCNTILDAKKTYARNNNWCPECRRKHRSKEYKKEKLAMWVVNSEQEYKEKKISRMLKQKFRTLCNRKSNTEKRYQKSAWQYWLEHMPDGWMEDYLEKAGLNPWDNPKLTQNERWNLRYNLDNEFHLFQRLRNQLRKKRNRCKIGCLMREAINREGNCPRAENELGYTISQLKERLERLFTSDMTWEAFRNGEIHIDHIRPQAKFNLQDPKEWKKCWALSNLQPLWAADNQAKSDKWDGD